ncbi:MAG: nucleotidyl transferase AbiEii/AbiGii toxin family protein [Candidatus Gastranaerophilaceae bacterium]
MGLSIGVIEKDYWVTRILRELASSEFANEFIFKGGTSLSKIWFEDFGRFSEDIDILLTTKSKHRSDMIKRLKEFVNFVDSINGIDFVIENSTDLEKDVIGGNFYYKYAGFYNKDIPEFIKREILLEPGYRGGSYPTMKKEMNSFVASTILSHFGNQVPSELLDYKEDIIPFSLQVLGPERIFLEKLEAIKNSYNKGKIVEATRHYYDLYNLIKLEEIQNLKSSPNEIKEILEDISINSKKYYGIKEPSTLESIKTCEALTANSSEIARLEARYKNESGLYYKEQTDFQIMVNQIIKFVQEL